MRRTVSLALVVVLSAIVLGACTSVTTASPPRAAASVQRTTVSLQSSPDPADIYLEGKFIGSTPMAVALEPGTHRIEIKRPGFKSWQRELTVMPESPARLTAILERE